MKAETHARIVIHIYEGTAREVMPLITDDRQVIRMVIKTVKIACSCGNVSLDEILFTADETQDSA